MPESDYLRDLVTRFWKYRRDAFGDADYFDRPLWDIQQRPPVFKRQFRDKNVLVRLGASTEEHSAVLQALPPAERHKWFVSMRSSQALAQSVFGNLRVTKRLDCLLELRDQEGLELFPITDPEACLLEHKLDYLGETGLGRTSVDVMFANGYRTSVECKLTEDEFGTCSRPELRDDDPSYDTDFCDGKYAFQKNRTERCPLTVKGIRYWDFLPELTTWHADHDHIPCPIRRSYQIIRTLLAACVNPTPQPKPDLTNGHAVVVFDERNPAFKVSGKARAEYVAVKENLKDPSRLRECTWQQIVAAMRKDPHLGWLTDALHEKYGF